MAPAEFILPVTPCAHADHDGVQGAIAVQVWTTRLEDLRIRKALLLVEEGEIINELARAARRVESGIRNCSRS